MRTFAALPLPEGAVTALRRVGERLKQRFDPLKLVKPEGLHITLLFFGEIPPEKAGCIMELMEEPALRTPRIRASLGGLDRFPPRGNPRVIYQAINQGAEEISACYRSFRALIENKDRRLIRERRRFIPHVTLGRNKGGRIELNGFEDLAPLKQDALEQSFWIDRLVLYESILKPQGAEYKALKTVIFL